MRTTSIVYIVGALALGGVIPFAGFWSKDEILFEASHKNPIAYWLLVIAAAFTAFYMTRQVIMVFFGKPKHAAAEHASESPRVMTTPLIVLAIFAALIGFINITGGFTHWLEPEEVFTGLDPFTAIFSTTGGVRGHCVGLFHLSTARRPRARWMIRCARPASSSPC